MENLLAAPGPMEALSNRLAQEEILSLNEKSEQFGLSLTEADAAALVQTRSEALAETGRIEIGGATVAKLIDAFCDSAWINRKDYAATLHELTELFYTAKNETEDQVSDDELIDFLKDCFERRCGGSLELLAGRELEKLAENLRFGVQDYRNMDHQISFEEDLPAEEEEAAEEEWEKDRWEELENE